MFRLLAGSPVSASDLVITCGVKGRNWNQELPPVDSNSEDTEHTSHVSAPGIHANASSTPNSSGPQIHSGEHPLKDQDPTYTTVSFQKNPASPTDTSVVFSQEEPATEYATVRHHTPQQQL
ncbi:hypothetical protein AOLI_G00233820 [Acnodon oligacanthus]